MGPENHFLTSLSRADRAALAPHLTPIDLPRNEVLAESGQYIGHAFLPIGSIISVVTTMKDGRSVESRTIGRESGYGMLHSLGSRLSYELVTVQVGGPAWRIGLEPLAMAARQSPSLVKAIVVHGQATLVQSAQQVACNALHGVDARLCRWLLLTQDRLCADVLPLTQEHLSIMLGVQRTTVTAAALNLQSKGQIAYSRGKIRVLDRQALMACSCECYDATEQAVGRILNEYEPA
ncbi:MAG TPA: Crp/Fnr family transcriptional regulator [Caulobacteraceae bacterium]|nr:Crp/Fnr family transcriptional regulator [Caulobacteraceae bacterium]